MQSHSKTPRYPFRIFLVALFAIPTALHGAEIMVPATTGALRAAINDPGTVDGDTLLLAPGVHSDSGLDINITKSLTIRSASGVGTASIVEEVRMDAPNITLQGLEFNGHLLRSDVSGGTRVIVENRFVNGAPNFANDPTNVYFIGNSVDMTAATTSGQIEATRIIVAAGNTFQSGPGFALSMGFGQADQLYLLGNEFDVGVIDNGSAVFLLSNVDAVWAIGNRMNLRLDQDYNTASDRLFGLALSGIATVSNNLIKLTDVSGLGGGSVVGRLNMISIGNGDSSTIQNNVFDFTGLTLNDLDANGGGVVNLGSSATVQGNLFLNTDRPLISEAAGTEPFNVIRNNLCFNTTFESCPTGNGNLDADPLLVDSVDYQLGSMSPAIDAGPDIAERTDIDGTRMDMGIYGGSFPIDQYDAQRESASTEPWIYPLFDAAENVNVIGDLSVRVVGIARMR